METAHFFVNFFAVIYFCTAVITVMFVRSEIVDGTVTSMTAGDIIALFIVGFLIGPLLVPIVFYIDRKDKKVSFKKQLKEQNKINKRLFNIANGMSEKQQLKVMLENDGIFEIYEGKFKLFDYIINPTERIIHVESLRRL